jgi:LmbE family N-acetylglucosaminyl deacetylase
LIVTQAHEPQWSAQIIAQKASEVEAVAAAYGMIGFYKLGLPTTRLDQQAHATLIDAMRPVIENVRADMIYIVHPGDVHTDHYAVFTAAMSIFKTFYMKALGLQRILAYETLSSTEAAAPLHHRAFVPTVYRDISPYLDRKIDIMALYTTEAQTDPAPRGPSAIRALERYRGASVNVEYAEAFQLVREFG